MRRHWHSCQPIDLHRMARRYFVNAKRIELQKLARELGISRATAYRWAGSAEQLVGEVLCSLTDDTFRQLEQKTVDMKGGDRIVEVLERGMQSAYNFPALRRFLRSNPEQGLKVVASQHGPVQGATIANVERLITTEVEAGNLELPVKPEVMAYALTRIVESFLYADLITGSEPDIESASKILRMMLRAE